MRLLDGSVAHDCHRSDSAHAAHTVRAGRVGATVSYFFWMRRAVMVPESRKFTLETLRLLELRMVSPAYVILFLTGLGLIDRARWGWSTPGWNSRSFCS